MWLEGISGARGASLAAETREKVKGAQNGTSIIVAIIVVYEFHAEVTPQNILAFHLFAQLLSCRQELCTLVSDERGAANNKLTSGDIHFRKMAKFNGLRWHGGRPRHREVAAETAATTPGSRPSGWKMHKMLTSIRSSRANGIYSRCLGTPAPEIPGSCRKGF